MNLLKILTLFFSVLLSINTLANISSIEIEYDMYCNHEASVEIESKITGERRQVMKAPKITVGTRVMSNTRSFMDADVFRSGEKQYRFTVETVRKLLETTNSQKRVAVSCHGTRYDNDGSITHFCNPWIEVLKIGPYGFETFLGYEENGSLIPSTEIRFRTIMDNGKIIDSMINQVPRKTWEDENEIWRIYYEKRNCIMTPKAQ